VASRSNIFLPRHYANGLLKLSRFTVVWLQLKKEVAITTIGLGRGKEYDYIVIDRANNAQAAVAKETIAKDYSRRKRRD